MPRNMSFAITTDQVLNRSKTVTRRDGWRFLREGEILNACKKCMGLKKGETVERLCLIQVTSLREEPLHQISKEDLVLEGFPEMSREEFIDMFMKSHKGVSKDSVINRIEFIYI